LYLIEIWFSSIKDGRQGILISELDFPCEESRVRLDQGWKSCFKSRVALPLST